MNKRTSLLLHPVVTGLLLAAVMIGASYLLGEYQLSAPLRLALVALPALAFLLVVVSWSRYYRQSDEMHQKILLEALAGALITCALAALGLYYLQKAFFPPSAYPDLEYFGDVFAPSFLVGFYGGWWRATRRYQ